jgi:glucose/arabinose dehydrogenase
MPARDTLVLACLAALGFATVGRGQTSPLPGAVQPGTVHASFNTVATGLVSPVALMAAPGDPSDLYVVDQAGKIDVIHNGVMQPTPLIDLTALENGVPLKPSYDERGLLGLAFSPGFANPASPGFHTLYTYQSEATGTAPANFAPAPGTVFQGIDHQNVLTEWKVNPANPAVVDTTTRRDLLREDHPALNHNGGTIAFGTDGMLYLGIGDGGTANDSGNGHLPNGNAPDLSVIMGKILRIDPNSRTGNRAYGIPADNPFVNTAGALPEIYAYGLRNPYRFSFDQPTGRLLVGDVGQNNIEEADIVTAGGNYGWSVKEGTFLFNRTGANPGTIGANSPGSPNGLIDPVLEYDHTAGTAIVGGFVYRGSLFPQLVGKYVFGDFSNGPFSGAPNGRIFYADLATGQINEFNLDAPLGRWLKGLGQDQSGEIYVLASSNLGPTGTTGVVMELVPEPTTAAIMSLCALALLCRRRIPY